MIHSPSKYVRLAHQSFINLFPTPQAEQEPSEETLETFYDWLFISLSAATLFSYMSFIGIFNSPQELDEFDEFDNEEE
jgi:hypothetical protein